MDTILFITDLHTGAHVIEISGVFERAARFGWRVIEVERDRITRPLAEFFRTWRPAGCIMECGKLVEAIDIECHGVPVVYIDPPVEQLKKKCRAVTNDADALAAMAFRELSSLDCVSYAFAGWCERTGWSVSRGEAFARCVAGKGRECAVYDEPWHDTCAVQERLAAWLKRLPRRVGVFAANDYAAEQVAGACALAGLESPGDVAIVGVDNDVLLCENTYPSLTSIEPDFREAGRLAADLLREALDKSRAAPIDRKISFGPVSFVRRQSTRLVNSADRRIVRAVERIRRDACTGLKAADVIAETGLSRRLAEKRFFEATGRTILGEIQEIRLAKAFELLRDRKVPIGWMAEMCGWESDSYFKRFFKAKTGLTPREWRQSHAG